MGHRRERRLVVSMARIRSHNRGPAHAHTTVGLPNGCNSEGSKLIHVWRPEGGLYSVGMTFSESIYERLSALLKTSGVEMELAGSDPDSQIRALNQILTAVTSEFTKLICELAVEIDALRAEIDRKG
jgi:hypothetical protein